jgi:hypothetical protein
VAHLQNAPQVKAVMDTHHATTGIVFIVEKVGMKLQQPVQSPVHLVLMKSVMMTKFASDTHLVMTRALSIAAKALKMHLNHVQHHAVHLLIVKLGKHASHSPLATLPKQIFPLSHFTVVIVLKKLLRYVQLPAQAVSMKIVQMGNCVIHTPPVASVILSFVEQVGQMLPPVVSFPVLVAHPVTVLRINSVSHQLPVMRFSHSFAVRLLMMQQYSAPSLAHQAIAVNVQMA